MFDGWFGLGTKPAARQALVPPRIGNIVDGQTVVSSDRAGMAEIFGNFQTDAGASVTDKTAMRVSAVYRAVALISGAVAGVPLPIYERDGEDRQRVQHDLWWLLNERSCDTFSAATFWEFITAQMLLRGDAYAYIVRNRAGVVTGLIPWPHSQVQVERQTYDDPRQPARLKYYFSDNGKYFGADQDDVLHFPGFGFDGIRSMSVIQWGARNGIGIAIKGDEYAGKFFASGARPALAIKTPGEFTVDQQTKFRDAWINKFGTTTGVDQIPFFLTEGLDVKELSINSVDGQILESRQWQVVDIARAFGLPPHMLAEMGKASYNNTENLGIEVVKFCFGPHFNRFEQELNIKLFRGPRYFTEFNTDGLQRGDSTARANFYKAALGGTQNPGWMTPNQVRKIENLPPIDGGDTLHKPEPAAGKKPPASGTDTPPPDKEDPDESKPA